MEWAHKVIRDWALGSYGEGGYLFVQGVIQEQIEDPQHTSEYWTREQDVGFSVGEVLEEYWEWLVNDAVGESSGPLFDIITGSISGVNWNQLGMELSEEELAEREALKEAETRPMEELEAASDILKKL